MIDVLAVVAVIVALAAGLCGHAAQPFPLAPAWRWLCARLAASNAPKVPEVHPIPERPACARTRPLWAHSQPLDYDEAA